MTDDTYVLFDTSLGNFVVELYNQATPLTVANFLSYVENPTPGANYNDSFFHRLVPGFVLQGGGYDIQGSSVAQITPGPTVPSEYNASYPNVEGSIAMALSTGPNSATDEFFFNLGNNSSALDNTSDGGPFTVFGKVAENWSVIQNIASLPTVDLGAPFDALPVQGTVDSAGVTLGNTVQYYVSLVQPIANTQAAQPVLDDATSLPFSTVTLSDPGNPTGAADTIRITIENASGNATSAYGMLSLPPSAASTGLTLSSTGAGTYLLSTASSITALQTALAELVFTPAELGSGASPVAVTLDVALLADGGSQGTIDNQDTTLVISHDASADATIAGPGGVAGTLSFSSSAQAALATKLFAGVVPANALFASSPGGAAMTSSQTAAIDGLSGAVSITGNGAANETIAAGAGAFAFTAGSGSGTVVAGAGNDFVYFPGGGNWLSSLGNGADTVVAATGNDTVATGLAGNFVFLGAGSSSVASAGTDTVLGGTGSATVQATGGNSDEVFSLGAPLQFIAGTGTSTVVAGAVSATVIGGASGGSLVFSDGATSYLGGGGTDTVVGLNGSLTVQGGAGGGLYFGGTAGNNAISAGSGNTTAFGGGAGDVLTATGSASDLFAGGAGNETLTGAGSSGSNTFFAGFGPETLVGGTGNTALVAGAGTDLLVGGTGLTLFDFVAGRTAGASDTISGFNPSHDFVQLAGYSASEASVVANATVVNGSSVIALSDGTQITFAGVTQLSASSFT